MPANHTKPTNDKAVHPRSAPMDIDSLEGVARILNSILGQLSSKKRRQARARETLRAAPQPERNGVLSKPAVPAASALAPSGGMWLVRGDRYKMARGSEAQNEMDDPPEFIVLALDRAETLPMNQIRSIVERDSTVPVIVCGPSYSTGWRKMALEAGAFACVSRDTPFADQLNVIAAATRYRAARLEIRKLREEAIISAAAA